MPEINYSFGEESRTAVAGKKHHTPNFGRKNFGKTVQTEAKAAIESRLANPHEAGNFKQAMAYADKGQTQKGLTEDAYTFADVIDIINPLQHIPVLNYAYRGITGDEIKPMSQIIGGAIFGGPAGAVSGTVNAVIKHETGKDIAGNAFALLRTEPGKRNAPALPRATDHPESRLNAVAKRSSAQPQDLPGTALSFANLAETGKAYEKVKMADGRTAGHMVVEKRQNFNAAPSHIDKLSPEYLPPREAITRVNLSPMPQRYKN